MPVTVHRRSTPMGTAVFRSGNAVTNTPPAAQTAVSQTYQEVLLDVHVNGQDVGTALLLQRDQSVYAQAQSLEIWRIQDRPANTVKHDDLTFYPLDSMAGVSYRVDFATQSLWISAPAGSFPGSVVDGLFQTSPPAQTGHTGGFFNYDVYATRAPEFNSTSAALEAGIFNSWGVGMTDYLGRQTTGTERQWVRLSTNWTKDFPDLVSTLRLGDSITRPGLGGSSVLFGGVQYGTDFSTQPYFVTFPVPSISGQAVLPSIVDLYVNGQLVHSQNVQPGPFNIPAIPVITGNGEAQMVVHDMLGRTQVVTVPFYASSQLLKAGLNDYSFSTGEIRDNYGIDSNDYGPFVASALFRRGLSDSFTGELRGATSDGTDVAGLGGVLLVDNSGTLTTSASLSHSALGTGTQGLIAFSHQGHSFGVSLSVQVASDRYTDIGYTFTGSIPRQQIAAGISMPVAYGTGSLGLLRSTYSSGSEVELATAGYGFTWDHVGSLSASAFHSLNGESNYGAFLFFTIPLSDRSSATIGATNDDGTNNLTAGIQKDLPAGTGSGYRLQTEIGPDPQSQGELDYQNDVGTYSIGAYQVLHQTTYYGEVRGGIGLLDGGAYFSRYINGAFGLAEVPGLADVPVYVNNQPVAHTDSEGRAFLPDLLAYQHNPVRIEPNQLPLDTDIGSDNEDAVPAYRSGVVVRFPVTTVRGATLTLQLPNGKPVPAGAEVSVTGQPGTALVGFNGQVYLTNLPPEVSLSASWDDQRCAVSFKLPATQAILPDLGIRTCRMQKTKPGNGKTK
ncbi:MAG: fimbria/pilus outer membrane usher protein [Gammaproteobacteria bacterium]